ncbi:MAG: sulfatase-like hydrolase/transferase, partial [Bdellovibrionales bacterium]|nr:sulfatase-like hydrolase/transferase [Bdellovibrionales bacterium]
SPVDFFFNRGKGTPCRDEQRALVASPRDVPTYDKKPEMSAVAVTDRLLAELEQQSFDVAILNFANCDMVGHTGDFAATVQAVETVDRSLGRVLSALDTRHGAAIIIADHGNADQMIDYETGEPHTYHTMHPVPFIVYGAGLEKASVRSGGALCDVAPSVLALLGVAQPAEMTGTSLVGL